MCLILGFLIGVYFMGRFKRPLICLILVGFLMGFLIGVLMGVIYTFYNQIIQIILQYMDYKGLILE